MRKIKTIFERENNKVIDVLVEPLMDKISVAKATEKLDGMNVRVTIRSGTCVRLEPLNLSPDSSTSL